MVLGWRKWVSLGFGEKGVGERNGKRTQTRREVRSERMLAICIMTVNVAELIEVLKCTLGKLGVLHGRGEIKVERG